MNKRVFEVYLTTGAIIRVVAEKYMFEYAEDVKLKFFIDRNVVAIFMIEGICGVQEVENG